MKTAALTTVTEFLNQTLRLEEFADDPSNNGLQVGAARGTVSKVAFAVDANLAVFEAAARRGAELLVTHHGLSWGAEPRRFTGFTARRLEFLFKRGLSLYAAHLPLDAHELYGNNAQLADLLRLTRRKMFFTYHGMEIGMLGERAGAVAAAELLPQARLFVAPAGAEKVRKIAVVSGGAGLDGLLAAIDAQAELLVTGEVDHAMYATIMENTVHVAALGHYASEIYGVQALERLIEEEFGLECFFVDVPSGL